MDSRIAQAFSSPRASCGLRAIWLMALPFALVRCIHAQSMATPTAAPMATEAAGSSIQPAEQLGADDLVELSVTNCPELTRTFRVSASGSLSLSLLHAPLPVAGLTPSEVSDRLRAALVRDEILNEPVVNVAVLEYRSRPVSVVGAVNHPLTFQATGRTTLLDALAKAGGLSPVAGSLVLVTTHPAGGAGAATVQTIDTRQLIAGASPATNLQLHGGEEIRVPEGEKIFVTGDVIHPGMYPMQNGAETTVIKAIALSSGLAPFNAATAYISRRRSSGAGRDEIAVPLKQILSHQVPDVLLLADDILYVPTSSGKQIASKVFGQALGVGQTAAGFMIVR